MEFLPWKTFSRIVVRYGGDSRVRTLSCGEQYRAMAFAQLTYRESLRDIETCCRSRRRSCTTWASASLCGVRRWPTPTKRGIGTSTSTLTRTDPLLLIES